MDIDNANCKLRLSKCADMEILPLEKPLKINCEITALDHLVSELHRVFSRDHVNVHDVQKLMSAYVSNPKDWKKYAKFDRFRYTRNLVDSGNGAFNIMILCWGPGHASAIHDHADSHCFMKLLHGSLEEVRFDWPQNIQPEVLKKLKQSKYKINCTTDEEDANYNNNMTDINRNYDNPCQKNPNDFIENDEKIRCQENTFRRNGEHYDSNGYKNGGHEDKNQNDKCNYDDFSTCCDEGKSMVETKRTLLEVNDVCYINDAIGLHRMENPSHVDGAVSLHLYCPPFDSCRVFDIRTGKPTQVKVTFTSVGGKRVLKYCQLTQHCHKVDGQSEERREMLLHAGRKQ